MLPRWTYPFSGNERRQRESYRGDSGPDQPEGQHSGGNLPCADENLEHGDGVQRKILFWLEEGREPTEHILNEIMDLKEKYEKIQQNLVFILRNEDALKNATLCRCLEMLPKIQVFFHDFGKDKEMTARRMYVDSEKLPLMVVTDGACQGMFASVGYSVGMADMLLRIFHV